MNEKIKYDHKSRHKKTSFIVIGVVIGIALLAFVTYYSMMRQGNTTSPTPESITPSQNATMASIPVSSISTTAKFYDYDSSGVTIRYFAVKDAQGNIHAAFDACDVCYEAKKGYKQNGNVMHCINCGREFSITGIGTENTAGGCWPSYLSMNINGENIVINNSDLEAKRYLFV